MNSNLIVTGPFLAFIWACFYPTAVTYLLKTFDYDLNQLIIDKGPSAIKSNPKGNDFTLDFAKRLICYSKELINLPKKFKFKQTILTPLIRKKYYDQDNFHDEGNFFTIIIIGGSQGAKIFDTLINKTLVKISRVRLLKVIHQTSEKNILSLKNFYKENKIENKVFNFDQNLNEFLRQSDLCITRAGASSLAELSLYNIPFIAIPLPTSKDNHQYENAKFYEQLGCNWVLNQQEINQKSINPNTPNKRQVTHRFY